MGPFIEKAPPRRKLKLGEISSAFGSSRIGFLGRSLLPSALHTQSALCDLNRLELLCSLRIAGSVLSIRELKRPQVKQCNAQSQLTRSDQEPFRNHLAKPARRRSLTLITDHFHVGDLNVACLGRLMLLVLLVLGHF